MLFPRIGPATLGGSLGVVLLVGLALWFGLGKGGSSGDEAVAREPQAGSPYSWVPRVKLESADATSWKAGTDPGTPPPSGLLTAIPVPDGQIQAFTFAAPATALVGFVTMTENRTSTTFEWVRHDLRKLDPIGRVVLTDEKTEKDQDLRPNFDKVSYGPAVAALSPSGNRLAVRDGLDRFVSVWDSEGKRLATLKSALGPRGVEIRTRWVGFADDNRLWILAGKQLQLHDIASGKMTTVVPGDVVCPPGMTPGGKWLVACTAQAVMVLNAASGELAGTIPLPVQDQWGSPAGKWCEVAVHPSGARFAVGLENANSDVLLGVWDLAGGRLTDSICQTFQLTQTKAAGSLRWMGERQILCGPLVIDLDLHGPLSIVSREPPDAKYAAGPMLPNSRVWAIRTFSREDWAIVGQKFSLGKTPRPMLTAASIPDEITEQLRAAKAGFLWHPGVAVRIAITDSVPRRHRHTLAVATADLLSKEGYRIDSQAPVTLELNVVLGSKTKGRGQQIEHDKLSPEMKQELMRKPGAKWHELADAYDVTVQGRALGADGKPAFQTPPFGSFSTVKRGAGENAAWDSLAATGVQTKLPRWFVRDAAHQRVGLPRHWQFGVDGLLPAKVEAGNAPKDDFSLPEDG